MYFSIRHLSKSLCTKKKKVQSYVKMYLFDVSFFCTKGTFEKKNRNGNTGDDPRRWHSKQTKELTLTSCTLSSGGELTWHEICLNMEDDFV